MNGFKPITLLPILLAACAWDPATEGLGDMPSTVGTADDPAILAAWPDSTMPLQTQLTDDDGVVLGDVLFMPNNEDALSDPESMTIRADLYGLDPTGIYRVTIDDSTSCEPFNANKLSTWMELHRTGVTVISGDLRDARDAMLLPDGHGNLDLSGVAPFVVEDFEGLTVRLRNAATEEPLACGVVHPIE